MTVTADIGGADRSFDMYLPEAWQYYVEQNGEGLPLLLVFHGGAQNPVNMELSWPFWAVAKGLAEPLENRFVVVYPYGAGMVGSGLFDGDNTYRGWNVETFFRGLTETDDPTFIDELIVQIEATLQAGLADAGVSGPGIDRNRIYFMGYSMGGMLIYRLLAEPAFSQRIGAAWVVAGAHGGNFHNQLGTPGDLGDTVEHRPAAVGPGGMGTSITHHLSSDDEVVPYGEWGAGLTPSPQSIDTYQRQGFAPPDYEVPEAYAAASLPQQEGVNAVAESWEQTLRLRVEGTATADPAFDLVWPGSVEYRYVPLAAITPQARMMLSSGLSHVEYAQGDAIVRARGIWNWFLQHPLVQLP